jgi:hypothetical protein
MKKHTKFPARSLPLEGEMDFAYISTGILILFIFLAALKCEGQRNGAPALPAVNPIETQ